MQKVLTCTGSSKYAYSSNVNSGVSYGAYFYDKRILLYIFSYIQNVLFLNASEFVIKRFSTKSTLGYMTWYYYPTIQWMHNLMHVWHDNVVIWQDRLGVPTLGQRGTETKPVQKKHGRYDLSISRFKRMPCIETSLYVRDMPTLLHEGRCAIPCIMTLVYIRCPLKPSDHFLIIGHLFIFGITMCPTLYPDHNYRWF